MAIRGVESYLNFDSLLGDCIFYMHIKATLAEKCVCSAEKGVGGL